VYGKTAYLIKQTECIPSAFDIHYSTFDIRFCFSDFRIPTSEFIYLPSDS
jgi:hypothetical protein